MEYIVISKEDFEWLKDKAKDKCTGIYSKQRLYHMKSFPAQEMWDACKDVYINELNYPHSHIEHQYPTLESFLKTKA